MARKFRTYRYRMRHPEKYIGNNIGKDGTVVLKSSWELEFLRSADLLPNVRKVGYEIIEIPYHHPFKGCTSIYMPDFLVEVQDMRTGTIRHLLVEIKPNRETSLKEAGRNATNKVAATINKAKWTAAASWATRRGFDFVVMTEKDMFGDGGRIVFKPVSKMTKKTLTVPKAPGVRKLRKPKPIRKPS